MDLDLYKGQILEFAGSIPRVGRLDAPDASADAHSRLCGSRITIDIKLDGNVIADYAHEPKACAIGQASASVVARTVVGLTVDEVNDGAEIMTAILKEKTPPSVGSLERPRAVPPGRGLPQSAQLGVPSLRSTPTRDCGIGFVTR